VAATITTSFMHNLIGKAKFVEQDQRIHALTGLLHVHAAVYREVGTGAVSGLFGGQPGND